jgi:hypothetical protein
VDLGALVAGGLGAAGWASLESVTQVNGLLQILGQGELGDGSNVAFLLLPLPEPGVLVLLLAAALGGWARRRG